MKQLKSLMLMISMTVFTVVLLGACGNQDQNSDANGEQMHEGQEMHESGDMHEGHDHEGHDHGSGTTMDKDDASGDTMEAAQYQCPMKCEGEKTYESNVGCPVCGMDLEKIDA